MSAIKIVLLCFTIAILVAFIVATLEIIFDDVAMAHELESDEDIIRLKFATKIIGELEDKVKFNDDSYNKGIEDSIKVIERLAKYDYFSNRTNRKGM